MKSEKRKQILTLSILVVAILVITIGFAAFSVTLRINSSATINPNSGTFSVKFSTTKDTLTVADVTPTNYTTGLTVTNGKIDNSGNPTISNLSIEFKNPGDYVEYVFYARNEGEYNAYLNNINFIGTKSCEAGEGASNELVQSACNSISLTVTVGGIDYITTTGITDHILNKNTGEEVKVTLKYADNGARADGPFTVNFGEITMVYSTINDSSYTPDNEETPDSGSTQVYKPQYYYFGFDWSGTVGSTDAPSNPSSVPPTGEIRYLGYDVTDGKVSTAYACFVRNDTEYCLKGADDGEAYETNKTVLEDAFKDVENACSFGDDYSDCGADGVYAYAYSNGRVDAIDDNGECNVFGDGDFDCSEY